MQRVRCYLWGHEDGHRGAQSDPATAPAMRYFRDTRMQAVGVDNSTKLSAFLAVGALSPRMIWDEVLRCGLTVACHAMAPLRHNAGGLQLTMRDLKSIAAIAG